MPPARWVTWVAVPAIILGLAWAALTVAGVEPWDDQGPRTALVCVLVLALVGVGALLAAAWHRAELERDAAGVELDAAQAAADRERERAAHAEARAEAARKASARHERDADDHRRSAVRAVAALERERHWSQELRSQVVAMHQARGALARRDDTRSLVLRVALDLTDAPKGLLLAREDRDGDGRLDVVAAEGFDEDPRRSELAQRFAARVIERDEVIRESTPPASDAAVDSEITSLIAIPIYMADAFHGVVVCAGRPGGFDECDDDVLLSLGAHAGSVLHNAERHGRLRAAVDATVGLLADAVHSRDPLLREGAEDVAAYAEAAARALGMDERERELLGVAVELRDVGKLGIPERVLLVPGPLTAEERAEVERHPGIGARLVERVPGLEDVAPIVLHHHERWDGAGYPGRLQGEETSLGARVTGVADAFAAMTERRPYRERITPGEACDELERCAGTQFDPGVVAQWVAEVRTHPRPPRQGPVAEVLAAPE